MVRPGGVLQDQSGTPGRFFIGPVATSEARARILLVGLFVFAPCVAALRVILAGIGVIGSGALHVRPETVGRIRNSTPSNAQPRPYNGAIADS